MDWCEIRPGAPGPLYPICAIARNCASVTAQRSCAAARTRTRTSATTRLRGPGAERRDRPDQGHAHRAADVY